MTDNKCSPGSERALAKAEAAFEFIRLNLIDCLDEPHRLAFWKAVEGREAVRAALTSAPVQGQPVAWRAFCQKTGGQMVMPHGLKDMLIEQADTLYAEHGYELQPLDVRAHAVSSTPRATPIDHSNEECPNFPGCHCADHCCDGWKHPSPEISSTDRNGK